MDELDLFYIFFMDGKKQPIERNDSELVFIDDFTSPQLNT